MSETELVLAFAAGLGWLVALLLLVRQVRLIREREEIGQAYRGDPKPPRGGSGTVVKPGWDRSFVHSNLRPESSPPTRTAAPEKPTEPPKVGAPKPPPNMDLRTGMKAPKEKGYNPPPVENVVRPEPTPTRWKDEHGHPVPDAEVVAGVTITPATYAGWVVRVSAALAASGYLTSAGQGWRRREEATEQVDAIMESCGIAVSRPGESA